MKRPAQFALTTVIIGTTAALLLGAEDPAAMAAPSSAVAQCQQRVLPYKLDRLTCKRANARLAVTQRNYT